MRTLGIGGIAQAQHAEIDEQAAVAIFGKSGEPVDVSNLKACALQRLDQRVAQPLRELVEGNEAFGRIAGLQSGMTPAIAERNARKLKPRRPDGAELAQDLRE